MPEDTPYDPYIPSGQAAGSRQESSNPQIQAIQGDLEGARQIMVKNIESIQERGVKAHDLMDKSENLATSAQGFRRGANRVRKQMWWKDMKMRMCIIVGIIILLLIIILPAVLARPK